MIRNATLIIVRNYSLSLCLFDLLADRKKVSEIQINGTLLLQGMAYF